MRVIAHSTQPLSNTQGSRQYDLFVDGKSFFVLPKVYEVGLKGSSSDVRIPGIISSMERGRLEQQAPARRVAAYSESGRNIVAPHSAEQVRRAICVCLVLNYVYLAPMVVLTLALIVILTFYFLYE